MKNFMSPTCTNSHYDNHATFVPSINHNKDVALLSYVELYCTYNRYFIAVHSYQKLFRKTVISDFPYRVQIWYYWQCTVLQLYIGQQGHIFVMINGRDKGCVIPIVTICANQAHEVFSYLNIMVIILIVWIVIVTKLGLTFHEYFFTINFKKLIPKFLYFFNQNIKKWSHFTF